MLADVNGVVHIVMGDPRTWTPQPRKYPSTATVRYVAQRCGADAAEIVAYVFPDWDGRPCQ